MAAQSPGVPPNWDLPDGTLWAIAVPPTSLPMGCGTAYGALPTTAFQRVPATGAPPALVSGETYYLYVQRDVIHGVRGVEGQLPGEELVEDHSKRPNIGASIDGLSAGLLRRHVGCGAQDYTGLGHRQR